MRDPSYSSIDPETGNVIYSGPLEITKGDHSNMPARTDAYLPGYERGHVTASSLGGGNSTANVVPQHHDVNRAFVSMEQGERTALRNGSEIYSEKTAVVNGKPGDRPEAFLISDAVTYADGHTESIHHSFTNVSNAEQESWNTQSAELPDTFDAANPGYGLRESMAVEEYADLMESTDAELPSVAADYAPADRSADAGAASAGDEASADAAAADADAGADADASADPD